VVVGGCIGDGVATGGDGAVTGGGCIDCNVMAGAVEGAGVVVKRGE
jgi:hypothetical protein